MLVASGPGFLRGLKGLVDSSPIVTSDSGFDIKRGIVLRVLLLGSFLQGYQLCCMLARVQKGPTRPHKHKDPTF